MRPVGYSPPIKQYPIFGTDGIRGKALSVLTPEIVLKIGYLCGLSLKGEGPFIIGKDSRESGAMIVSALTAGLTAAGREVWLLGICPTPAIPHTIKMFGASGGLMVSASHNPPEDNGIKIFNSSGTKINTKQQTLIEEGLSKDYIYSHNQLGQTYFRNELLEDYENSLIESVKGRTLKDVSIVLDLCWGSATACGEKIFKSLGANLITINQEPNGQKINLNCGSTNLGPLKEAVLNNNAQMGFAFDGDADRMIAIDEKGRIIDGDHVLYLWGSYLKANNALSENRLVATTMSNLGLEKSWQSKGGILERTPIGDKHVHKAMLEKNATLGGEQSGHILSSINGLSGDGILSAVQMSTICTELKLRLFEWRNQSFTAYPQKLVNVPISHTVVKESWKNSGPLQNAVSQAKVAIGDQGRILIRESGTEPLLRVLVESHDQKLVDSWSSRLAEVAADNFNVA